MAKYGSSFVCLFACMGRLFASFSCSLHLLGVGSLKMNKLCGRPENKHWKRQSYALQTYLCLCTNGMETTQYTFLSNIHKPHKHSQIVVAYINAHIHTHFGPFEPEWDCGVIIKWVENLSFFFFLISSNSYTSILWLPILFGSCSFCSLKLSHLDKY